MLIFKSPRLGRRPKTKRARFTTQLMIITLTIFSCSKLVSAAEVNKTTCLTPLENKTLYWRINDLDAVKQALQQHDPRFLPAKNALIITANNALATGPYSVTDKSTTPPSGNKQDYMTIGTYWWPNETDKSLPYVRKDGHVNPEVNANNFDVTRIRAFVKDVKTLALAAFFSQDDRYAKHAELLINTWFINPKTRMNPHLKFGQGIPGHSLGRPFGIIRTSLFIELIDAILLLKREAMISSEMVAGTRTWFSDYLHWLTSDTMAILAGQTDNNHGTFYDAQLMSYALFTGQCEMMTKLIKDIKSRTSKQINTAGIQTKEVARTKSLSYSIFNLQGFLKAARLAEHATLENIYTYQGDNAGSILDGLTVLANYAGREAQWPYQQIIAKNNLWQLMRQAYAETQNPIFSAAAGKVSSAKLNDDIILLTGAVELNKQSLPSDK
ncbi:MAG: alginate lyase family protein [Thalassotalea sp.]